MFYLIFSAIEEKRDIPGDNILEINAQEHIILQGTGMPVKLISPRELQLLDIARLPLELKFMSLSIVTLNCLEIRTYPCKRCLLP